MNLVTGASGFVGSWLMQVAPPNTIGVRREIPQGEFDTVIHCALSMENPRADCELIAAALDLRPNRFIYISSGAALFDGGSQYARQKATGEMMCRGQVIARLYSFIGPRLIRFAPYEMMTEALNKGTVTVRSGAVRSYMYAEDMAKRIWSLHEPGVHEVGSRLPVTMVELGCEIAKQTGANVNFDITEKGTWYVPEEGQIPRPLDEQVGLTLDYLCGR